jgi:hypothetical protein
MDETGEKHVKESKPSSERQRSHVFSICGRQFQKINIHTNTNMIIYICIHTYHVYNSDTVTRERKK